MTNNYISIRIYISFRFIFFYFIFIIIKTIDELIKYLCFSETTTYFLFIRVTFIFIFLLLFLCYLVRNYYFTGLFIVQLMLGLITKVRLDRLIFEFK